MNLLALHIDHSFHRNRQGPVLSAELFVKIQTFRKCFPGKALPPPSAKVKAAWNDLPNTTVDYRAKTGQILVRAPPPPQAKPRSDVLASSDAFSNGVPDDDSWTLVDEPTTTSDEAHPTLEGATGEGDDLVKSGTSHPDRSSNEQDHDQNSPRSPTDNSPSSDEESLSTSGGGSPIPVGFDNTIDRWLADYRGRGAEPFTESLIAYAAMSAGTARRASRIARAVVRKLVKRSYTEGKKLESVIRSAALGAFKNCWQLDDTSTEEPSQYRINIASLMGSLFDQKLSTAKDVHLCLSLLLEEKRFGRLCAMHALLTQANDKLCKNRNLPALTQFKDDITSIEKESRQHLWITAPHSKLILADILALIERWTASQAIKREESEKCAGTARTIRNSAVGPRLRAFNDPVVF